MKKVLSFLLSLLVVFCLFVPIFAEGNLSNGFSLCDLSTVGISAMKCDSITSAPNLDGNISSGEYPSFYSLSKGNGLFVLSDAETPIGPLYQENYISSDGQYFYVAVRIVSSSDYSFSTCHKKLGNVYALTLELGMTPGEKLANRCSVLHNEYYFSQNSGQCVGVTGHRVYYSEEGKAKFPLRISSVSAMYQDNGFLDSNGTKWTADFYKENVSFSVETGADRTIYTAEMKIPVGDVLLSVVPEERDAVLSQFMEKSSVLCGSFCTRFSDSFGKHIALAGVPEDFVLTDEKTFETKLKEKFFTEPFPWDAVDAYPLPLYLCGEIPKNNEAPEEKSDEDLPITQVQGSVPSENEVPTSTTKSEANAPLSTTEKVTLTTAFSSKEISQNIPAAEEGLEGNESIFSELPDMSDPLPEDTEIIYLSGEDQEETFEKGEESTSLLGKLLLLGTGVLLFAAVIVFAAISGRSEGTLEGRKGKGEKDRKKSQQNGKKK